MLSPPSTDTPSSKTPPSPTDYYNNSPTWLPQDSFKYSLTDKLNYNDLNPIAPLPLPLANANQNPSPRL